MSLAFVVQLARWAAVRPGGVAAGVTQSQRDCLRTKLGIQSQRDGPRTLAVRARLPHAAHNMAPRSQRLPGNTVPLLQAYVVLWPRWRGRHKMGQGIGNGRPRRGALYDKALGIRPARSTRVENMRGTPSEASGYHKDCTSEAEYKTSWT